MSVEEFENALNKYASSGVPFIFIIDFELERFVVSTLKSAKENGILFDIKGHTNFNYSNLNKNIKLHKVSPVSKAKYRKAFSIVHNNILLGNSYLLNLTFPTEIDLKHSLKAVFDSSKAPYKLLFKNEFILFSPECFVKIIDNDIFSYPMKGTIDATIPNAEKLLLSNQKEINEHNTIVDLIRNDLSMIAKKVRVTKFRYIDKIVAKDRQLLQVSSEIRGILPVDWRQNIADILLKLLPAGSISGAPKNKTIEIIQNAEKQKRGFYTGIFGIFDGKNLDSAVNIRFIENKNNKTYYRSGGGITAQSDIDSEYNELIQKIYVPTS